MKPDLVATDLDGTFLRHHGLLGEDNLAAAREAIAAGVQFVIATGRPRRWLQMLDPLKDLDPIVITSNGASIGQLATEMPHTLNAIPIDVALAFADALAPLRATFGVEYALGWGCEHDYSDALSGGRVAPRPIIRPEGHVPDPGGASVGTLTQLLEREPIIKLLAHSPVARTEELAERARAAAGDALTITFSWTAEHGTVECSAGGVSKGTALAGVITDLGLDARNCVAFGDMPNDLEMLRTVGHPFVMAESHPTMFDHGFPIAGHNDDGAVGQRIREFLRR